MIRMNNHTFYRIKKLTAGTTVDGIYIDPVRAYRSGKDFRPFSIRESDGAGFCKVWWTPGMIEGPSKHPLNLLGATKFLRRHYIKEKYPHVFTHGVAGVRILTARGFAWRVMVELNKATVQVSQHTHFEDAVMMRLLVRAMVIQPTQHEKDLFGLMIDALTVKWEQGLSWIEYRELYGCPVPSMKGKPMPIGMGGVL